MERLGPNHPNDDEKERKVRERVEDLALDDIAFLRRIQDEDSRRLVMRRQVAQDALAAEGQAAARQLEIRRAEEARREAPVNPPYGIPYLDQEHTIEAIRERIAEEQEWPNEYGRRAPGRDKELADAEQEARHRTLQYGREVAQALAMADVEPTTTVYTEQVTYSKKFSRKSFNMFSNHGKLFQPQPQISYIEGPRGWLLNTTDGVPGSRAKSTILMEDGRILTCFGQPESEESHPSEPRYRVTTKPNIPPRRGVTGETYSSVIGTRPDSDRGLPLLPVNTTIGRTKLILARERSIQEALVSLLDSYTEPA